MSELLQRQPCPHWVGLDGLVHTAKLTTDGASNYYVFYGCFGDWGDPRALAQTPDPVTCLICMNEEGHGGVRRYKIVPR